MTLQNFISKLNWRQVVAHFIAFWLIILSSRLYSQLYSIKIVDIARRSDKRNTIENLINGGVTNNDIVYFLAWTQFSIFIGLLVALIISITISIKHRWFWANTAIVFVVTFLMCWFDLVGWAYLNAIFSNLGMAVNSILLEYVLGGTISLALGLLIFCSNRLNDFIATSR